MSELPPTTFECQHHIEAREIDERRHVNNLVYLEWFINAALAHSAAVGWPDSRYVENEAGWVIRRHEIDYLSPSFEGEDVVIRTWIRSISRTSSVRQYEAFRPRDNRTLARGTTVWVWVNYRTGRPERIPEEIIRVFPIRPDQE